MYHLEIYYEDIFMKAQFDGISFSLYLLKSSCCSQLFENEKTIHILQIKNAAVQLVTPTVKLTTYNVF